MYTHTHTQKRLMSFRVSRDAPEAKSNTAYWEKWFQTLVITALITYSAPSLFSSPSPSFSLTLSLFLPSLPLDPSPLGFGLWPDVCHSAILLMASSLPHSAWSNGNGIFLLALSFHFFSFAQPSSLSPSLSLSSPPFSPSSLTSSRNSSLIQALAVCVQYVCVCAGSCVLYKTAS